MSRSRLGCTNWLLSCGAIRTLTLAKLALAACGHVLATTRTITPAEGNKAEHLLHDLLQAAGEAHLSVCCTGVTLDEQRARRNFEQGAVAATQQERLMCLNTGGHSVDVPMRRFVLESEEKMLLRGLERVRAKLAKLG
jgi:hypothetical protein